MKKIAIMMSVLLLLPMMAFAQGYPRGSEKLVDKLLGQKISQANEQAQKPLTPAQIFQNADEKLDELAERHAEYAGVLSNIKDLHGEILKCLNIQRDRAEFEEQEILTTLENIGPNLDRQLAKIENEELRNEVKNVLDHNYQFRGDPVIPFHEVLNQVAGFFNTKAQWGQFFSELQAKNK